MTDTENQPTSFVRWLHAQKNTDTERSMPYARIYQWGKQIQQLLGTDGTYDGKWIATELVRSGATDEDLGALVQAEAAWRVDTLVDHAEEAGFPIERASDPESEVSKALEHPDAVVLCGYRNHRGEGCPHPAIPGAGRCGKHGGDITNPEVRRSFLLVAFAKVFDGSRIAVEALIDVAENGRSEMARVQAAKELLDRAGVAQDQHVHIHAPGEDASEDEVLDDLRRRLSIATDRLRIQAIPATTGGDSPYELTSEAQSHPPFVMPDTSDDEIVDAVVVDEL